MSSPFRIGRSVFILSCDTDSKDVGRYIAQKMTHLKGHVVRYVPHWYAYEISTSHDEEETYVCDESPYDFGMQRGFHIVPTDETITALERAIYGLDPDCLMLKVVFSAKIR